MLMQQTEILLLMNMMKVVDLLKRQILMVVIHMVMVMYLHLMKKMKS